MKISIIGLGQFGYAMLYHLDQKQEFELWGNDKDQPDVDFMSQNRHPADHFTDRPVSDRVHFSVWYQDLLQDCDLLIIAVVSSALPIVCQNIKNTLAAHPEITLPPIISLTKALSLQGETPTQIIAQELQPFTCKISAFAGGTTARDLVDSQLLGATIAAPDLTSAQTLKKIFQSPHLRVQASLDLLGLQYASALKNIISIFAGIIDGLGYQYGSQTHIISLAAAECEKLALQFGAKKETFDIGSQCWGNDMFMSATGQTRNRDFGRYLGQNPDTSYHQALEYYQTELQKSVEGTNTIKVLPFLLRDQTDVAQNYPLLDFITQVAQDQAAAKDLPALLSKL